MIIIAKTRGLTKHFGTPLRREGVTAVNGLDLTVSRGSLFGLLGPNGSGKSTVLKLLTGLLNPTRGTLSILDGNPRSGSIRRRLGYLPEQPAFYHYLTAIETLVFYAGLFGIARRDARIRAGRLLERMGISEAARRPVGGFSFGMQRRLGLAQALIHDPDVLILDEPTAGLDPAGCQDVKTLLLEQRNCGKTVIVTSHLLTHMEAVCDTVCILHRGSPVAQGPLDQLLDCRDRIRFTAGALSDEQIEALQSQFRRVTGSDADMDHPRLSLDVFFEQTVRNAASIPPISQIHE